MLFGFIKVAKSEIGNAEIILNARGQPAVSRFQCLQCMFDTCVITLSTQSQFAEIHQRGGPVKRPPITLSDRCRFQILRLGTV